jgi:beta-glucosidase
MPSTLAVAASFDPALAFAGGAMIGAEARAKGFNVMLAGGANLIRDPWNGRDFEYFSEDVLLTGRMAGESIRGVQSNGIVSTIKHFALNAQESGRYVLDARLADAALRESDLLAFQLAIERGQPGSVMCSYNKVDGDWACENHYLLTDVLKRDWGFAGWVMSDWGAVHSTVKAANAGLDQESGQELDKLPYFGAPLQQAVEAGTVPMARLDDMVRRILRSMFARGLVDTPAPSTPQPIDYSAHADVAQRAAEEGIVLLKNARGLLPLARTAQRIVVIGAHADIGVLSGGGSSQVQAVSGTPLRLSIPGAGPELSFSRRTYHGSSPLQALRAASPLASITYVDATDPAAAAAIAKGADLVLFFAEQWRTEALDLDTLHLDAGQDALIDAVASANPNTVVVVESGGPVVMPWLDKVGAVVESWYPGERGGEAITRVLLGDVDVSGRLPVTFPADVRQAPRPEIPGIAQVRAAAARSAASKPATFDLSGGVPSFPVDYPEGADVGYRWYQRQGAKPLFPFGFGLSYTRFAYGHLEIPAGPALRVRFTVTNVGARAGSDVPQIYATPAGPGTPTRRLVGFERVTLAPGATTTVEVTIDPRLLARFDAERHAWRPAQGSLAIEVGHDAAAIALTGIARASR